MGTYLLYGVGSEVLVTERKYLLYGVSSEVLVIDNDVEVVAW